MHQDRARILLAEIVGDANVIFVTGKGGVGKSTVAALISTIARDAGLRCASINLGEFTNLEVPSDVDEDEGTLLATSTEQDSPVAGGDTTISIRPEAALVEYLGSHGFGKLASRLIATGVVGVVATAIPGLRDLLLLGKIKQIEREGAFDMLVVDTPSSGHAITFLTSPEGLKEIAKVGPLRAQAEDVLELLNDPTRAACVVVTTPEETPIQETLETIARLHARSSATVASIICNQMLEERPRLDLSTVADPSLVAAYQYRLARQSVQEDALETLLGAWDGPVLSLPMQTSTQRSDLLVLSLCNALAKDELASHLARQRILG
jgi:anion-transporting  ArsA/GET3 family ATPase